MNVPQSNDEATLLGSQAAERLCARPGNWKPHELLVRFRQLASAQQSTAMSKGANTVSDTPKWKPRASYWINGFLAAEEAYARKYRRQPGFKRLLNEQEREALVSVSLDLVQPVRIDLRNFYRSIGQTTEPQRSTARQLGLELAGRIGLQGSPALASNDFYNRGSRCVAGLLDDTQSVAAMVFRKFLEGMISSPNPNELAGEFRKACEQLLFNLNTGLKKKPAATIA